MKLQAFHNDKAIKAKYLARVKRHRLADNLVQGKGWENGKGCAVGCTLENYNHKQYETELGIPEFLARVEDTIFEGLDHKNAQLWPERFLRAIAVGKDLDKVKIPFLIFILENNLKSMAACKFDAVRFPEVDKALSMAKSATTEMIRCHKEGLSLDSARSAAYSAAYSSYSAAYSARSATYKKFANELIRLIKAL